ncbi:MAG: tetratricopeptide repeat protein [Planctomycetota bacterium]|jgi:Flp pilus assembly protein TadD
MKLSRENLHVLLLATALVLATTATYWQVQEFELLTLDDGDYVWQNQQVRDGLTWQGFTWAFTATHSANWHPLTWLSLMLDCELFESEARGCHTTNMLLHIANTLLLFWVMKKMTDAIWPSAFVAALFALHPLHIESVAWVSERKDVLSTLFWLLTMWAYARYTEHRKPLRYMLILLFFALGLLAKPMLVTLPFVLLLLDYWPLERMQLNSLANLRKKAAPLVVEKIPLSILTLISCVVTYIAQQTGGAVWSIPVILRIPNIFVAYARYIEKMLWPNNLAIYYPYTTDAILLGQTIVSVLVLIVISIRVFQSARNYKYLPVGWLWYLGTLVPVIGIIQVGSQARADRYTYVTLIGLFIIIAWGVADYAKNRNLSKNLLWLPALVVLTPLTIYTYKQIGYWQNSAKLYEHALAVTARNHFAHFLLASVLDANKETDKAIKHYTEALKLFPEGSERHIESRSRLAQLLIDKGRMDEAIMHCREILRAKPDDSIAHTNLGVALAAKGELYEAIAHYKKAIENEPEYVNALINLGVALGAQGELDEAISHFQKVLTLEPESAPAHYNLGFALKLKDDVDEAIVHLEESIRIDPNDGRAETLLKTIIQEQAKTPDENN